MSDNVEEEKKFSKKELLDMLEEQAKAYDRLPQGAMLAPVSHYDYHSLLVLLIALFRAESNSDIKA